MEKEAVLTRRAVAFHTFGCKVNQYETEELRGQLSLGGFDVVPMGSSADVHILNSCTVTADADSSCRQLVRKILREQPDSRVIVTGCYAERAPQELHEISSRVEVFGNREKALIAMSLGVPTACVETAAKTGVTALAERSRVFLKIQDGCDAHCTYCIIPSVRPDLICKPAPDILREAQALVDRGFHEIVLTGVRLGRYVWQSPHLTSPPGGRGMKSIPPPTGEVVPEAQRSGTGEGQAVWDFARLLKALLDLNGDFRIRLSSIEVTEIPDAVVELAASHPKMCPFFHIPLQSGDDGVLKRMGRWYTSSEYRSRLAFIRRHIPDAAFSGDVIVGFPGEGENEFENTVRLLEEEGFSRLHAFRYSVRPGTPAERLPDHVDGRRKAERVRRLVALDHTLRRRYAERFVGRPVRVLLESNGLGYTAHYVRAQASAAASEGHFQIITPQSVDSSPALIA